MASREWFKHDAWFLADDKIRDLGHEFGPGGPLVASALLQLAKRQKSDGIVTVKWSYLAEHAFIKQIARVKQIVARCCRIGFVRIHAEDSRSVTVEPVKWLETQGAGLGAERTATWRERKRVTNPLSQNGHGVTDSPSPGDTPSRARAQEGEGEGDIEEAKASSLKIDSIDRESCRYLARKMKERSSKARVKSPEKWANDMRLLRVNDDNTPEQIRKGIDWVFEHQFWSGIIQSAGGLRKHWPTIWAQMHPKANGNGTPVETSAEFLARRGAAA